MKEFGLPWAVHMILTIFVGFLWGGIIRIMRDKLLLGLLFIFTGGFFAIGWILDIVAMVTDKDIKYLT